MERWLVTGANGFLGSRLMKFYQEKYEITGAHHGNLDITDEAAAAEFVRAAAPQLVIHCAAISNTGTCQENPGLSEAVNVNGAVNLARACRETGSRLIFMSSIRFTQETGPWYRRRRRILRTGQCLRASQTAGRGGDYGHTSGLSVPPIAVDV